MIENLKTLLVSKVETKDADGKDLIASNGAPYKKLTLVELPETRVIDGVSYPVVSTARDYIRNVFGEGKLADGTISKAEAAFTNVKENSIVDCKVVEFDTTPYTIGNNTVNYFTTVLFNTENTTTVGVRQAKLKGCNIIDKATGEMFGTPIDSNVKSSTIVAPKAEDILAKAEAKDGK